MHYKNSANKGRELQLGATSLSQACERAVAATPNVCEIGGVNQFDKGYKL